MIGLGSDKKTKRRKDKKTERLEDKNYGPKLHTTYYTLHTGCHKKKYFSEKYRNDRACIVVDQ